MFPYHIATGGSQPPSPAATQPSRPTQNHPGNQVEQIAMIGDIHCNTCCQPARGVLRWKNGGRDVLHLGLYCGRCERWIKWVSQTPSILSVAPSKPTVQEGAQ